MSIFVIFSLMPRASMEEFAALVGAAATGVVVVGRGEPDAWSRRWPDEAAQEGENLRAIAAGFVAAGYRAEAVVVAWSDYEGEW